MTKFLKRSGAALLSLVLLCVLAIGAGAAASQTVGVKFWKERSDNESMTGDFEKGTAVLTIKNLPASVLTGSDVNRSITVTCNIQMDMSLLGELNTTARMCIWNKK